MAGGANVRKAVADHAVTDAKEIEKDVERLADEFAEACLDLGETIGLQRFSKAIAKARAERSNGKEKPAAAAGTATTGESGADKGPAPSKQ